MRQPPSTSPPPATSRLVALTLGLSVLGLVVAGLIGSGALDSMSGVEGGSTESWGYRSAEYHAVMDKALAWVDRLQVDPIALQAHGVKGKKKLAEALVVYSIALRYEDDPNEARRFRRRILQLAATTDQVGYHDMLTCDETVLKQNSMSYLRVMWLMQRAGLETSRYMDELKRVKPRFDGHFAERGGWQRAMFARYYDDFDLEKPPVLAGEHAIPSVVATRHPVGQYDRYRGYQLTHEIFVAFDYGYAESQSAFTASDLDYLASVLPPLIDQNIQLEDADLLSELVGAMPLLGLRDHPATKRGVDYLLEHQNGNGTWGDYEAERARMGELVDQKLYLHTTAAAIQALLEIYERPLGVGAPE